MPAQGDNPHAMTLPAETVIAHTRAWVARVVIGLNLCPFAAAVQARGQVRHVVCDAGEPEQLLATLCAELRRLAEADPAREQTTLLMPQRAAGLRRIQ
jgi:uncharacterized protein